MPTRNSTVNLRKLNSFDLKNQIMSQNLGMRRSSYVMDQSAAPSVILSDRDSAIMRKVNDNFDSSQDEIRRIVDDSKFDEFHNSDYRPLGSNRKRNKSKNLRDDEIKEPNKIDFNLSENQTPFDRAFDTNNENNDLTEDMLSKSLK